MFGTAGSRSGRKATGRSGVFSKNVNVGANVGLGTSGLSVGNSSINVVANSSGFYQNGTIIISGGTQSGDVLTTARAPGNAYLQIDQGIQYVSKATFANLSSIYGTPFVPNATPQVIANTFYQTTQNFSSPTFNQSPGIFWFNVNSTMNNVTYILNGTNGIGVNSTFAYTLDYFDWKTGTLPYQNVVPVGMCYGNGVFLIVGSNGFIARSTDGVTFSAITNITSNNIQLRSVDYGNGNYVAVGGDSASGGGNGVIYTSTTGSSWTQRTITSVQKGPLNIVVWGGGGYWFTGGNNQSNSTTGGILRSNLNDVTTWTSYFNLTDAGGTTQNGFQTFCGGATLDANAMVAFIVLSAGNSTVNSEYTCVAANGAGAFAKISNVAQSNATAGAGRIGANPGFQRLAYGNSTWIFGGNDNQTGSGGPGLVSSANNGFTANAAWSQQLFDNQQTGQTKLVATYYNSYLNVLESLADESPFSLYLTFGNNHLSVNGGTPGTTYQWPDYPEVVRTLNGNLVVFCCGRVAGNASAYNYSQYNAAVSVHILDLNATTPLLKSVWAIAGGSGANTARLWDAAFGNNIYCLLATNNVPSGTTVNSAPKVYYSSDLVTWTAAAMPTTQYGSTIHGYINLPINIVSANNRFVVSPGGYNGVNNATYLWGNGTSFSAINVGSYVYQAVAAGANIVIMTVNSSVTTPDVNTEAAANVALLSTDGGNSTTAFALPFIGGIVQAQLASYTWVTYGNGYFSIVYETNAYSNAGGIMLPVLSTSNFTTFVQSNTDAVFNRRDYSNTNFAQIFPSLTAVSPPVYVQGTFVALIPWFGSPQIGLDSVFLGATFGGGVSTLSWIMSTTNGASWTNLGDPSQANVFLNWGANGGGLGLNPVNTGSGSNTLMLTIGPAVGANNLFWGLVSNTLTSSTINVTSVNTTIVQWTPQNKLIKIGCNYDITANFPIVGVPRDKFQDPTIRTYIKT